MWTTDDGLNRYMIDLDAVDVVHHRRYDGEEDDLILSVRGSHVSFRMPRSACDSFVKTYLEWYTRTDDDEDGGDSDDPTPMPPGSDPMKYTRPLVRMQN
jgi:hypothetical protein